MPAALLYDASTSLSREWSFTFLNELEKNCNKIKGFYLIAFAKQALPLSLGPLLLSELIETISKLPFLPGSPEPYNAAKELAELAGDKRVSEVLVIWSMSKRPRLPFAYTYFLLKSLGSRYIAITTPRAYPPRWIDSYLKNIAEEDLELHMRAGKQRARRVAEKIGCRI